ncbi:carboxymethylenebutenolidase [Teratosphaeria nubilosa]|uniref:Carboxymethylenebutenolidase n=1 Tax=Teratosphaeria nubilosa TaxID=161662 RepID=A0A6G1KSX8_9PEZI|nr:carboxymethylenebutenolidase [Teratosphaeria nubilosa]
MNGHSNGVETPVALPSAKPFSIADNTILQPPLTRLGTGPPLVLLVPPGLDLKNSTKTLDPPPLQKWAEEGYAVAQITVSEVSGFHQQLEAALQGLKELRECEKINGVGLIAINISILPEISSVIDSHAAMSAIITHGMSAVDTKKPQLRHIPSGAPAATPAKDVAPSKTFFYANTEPFFTIPAHKDFQSAPAAVSHTRSLSFLRPLVGGPYFDLEAIWEEHTRFEFGERAVEKTMGTMVQEPYVNHIPTMTGGVGRERLTNFYRYHFIFNNPDDTALELVSRTVGIDRVIDEFNFTFTHDRIIDWLLPGVPPTGKRCEIPFSSVVNIRGDRLYHEHIAWDQATALRQLGLLPEYLPFPYQVDGKDPAPGKRFEYRLPAAGVETAKKLADESSVESNQMFDFAIREVASRS